MTKIMIVDDADFIRMFIRDHLAKEGFTDLIEAVDGEDALKKYYEYNPDVVFLDITMPKKDGLEVLAEILDHDEGAKVIMCSSHGEEKMIIKAIKLGAKDFIVKPFQPRRLAQTVNNILLN